MYKITTFILAVALIFTLIFTVQKVSLLESISSKNRELESKFSILEAENKDFRITTAILKDAFAGQAKAKPETIEKVIKVITFLSSELAQNEPNFAECWDRKLRTTNWGSMGPWGLLDECIDTVVKKESAILLREIDNAVAAAWSNCADFAPNAAEARERCGADRNFRLLSAADRVLFSGLTVPSWMPKQRAIITE